MADFEINKLYKESEFDSKGFKLHSEFSRDWWGKEINVCRYEKYQIIYIIYKRPDGLLCPVEYYDLMNIVAERSTNSIEDILKMGVENDTK